MGIDSERSQVWLVSIPVDKRKRREVEAIERNDIVLSIYVGRDKFVCGGLHLVSSAIDVAFAILSKKSKLTPGWSLS